MTVPLCRGLGSTWWSCDKDPGIVLVYLKSKVNDADVEKAEQICGSVN